MRMTTSFIIHDVTRQGFRQGDRSGRVSRNAVGVTGRFRGNFAAPNVPSSECLTTHAKYIGRVGNSHGNPHLVTELAESKARDEVIMSIGGHVSRAMLSRYSHVRMDVQRRALTRLPRTSGKPMKSMGSRLRCEAAASRRRLVQSLSTSCGPTWFAMRRMRLNWFAQSAWPIMLGERCPNGN